MSDEQPTVAQEVAEAEFDRFAAMMDLDVDESRMDADDLKSFRDQKHVLVRAMMRGHLCIDDKGQPVYTPQLGDTTQITFFEPTGATIMASDKLKRGESTARMLAMMGDMTKTSPQRFAKMAGRDLKVCQTIAILFLG